MFKPKLGFYDGITLFITDPTIFEHCKNRSKEYQLLGYYNVETDVKLWTFKGRYKNLDIATALIGGVRGVS